MLSVNMLNVTFSTFVTLIVDMLNITYGESVELLNIVVLDII